MRITGIDEKYYLIAREGLEMCGILEILSNHTGMRKDSFADIQVKRIFSDLFCGAVDLRACYRKYYIKEYDTFRDFLYQKEMLEYGVIDSLKLQEDEALWELKYTISGYSVRDLIGYENENLSLFNDFLKGLPI